MDCLVCPPQPGDISYDTFIEVRESNCFRDSVVWLLAEILSKDIGYAVKNVQMITWTKNHLLK